MHLLINLFWIGLIVGAGLFIVNLVINLALGVLALMIAAPIMLWQKLFGKKGE